MNQTTENLSDYMSEDINNVANYLRNGGSKMAMSANKFQLFGVCLHSIKKPLKLLISDTKFGVLIPGGNIWMDLRNDQIDSLFYQTHTDD